MTDGSVTIEVGMTLDEIKKDLKSLKSLIDKSIPANSGSKALQSLSNGFKGLGKIATSAGKACSTVTTAVTGVFTAAATKAKSFIEVYESAISVFKRKLGETGAGQMYDSLLNIAKGSKYAQEYIVGAGQTLVAMGVDASNTAKYVQIATDAMSGMGKSGEEVQAMSEMFGKMAMQTTLYTEDLNQLLTAGIPVYDILATKYKTNTDKIKQMASAGKLTSKDFEYLTEVLSGNVTGMEEFSVAGLALAGKTGTLSGALDSINSSFRTFALNLLDLDPRTESGQANIQKLQDVVGAFGAILEDVGTKFGFVGGWIGDFLDKLVTVETTVDENGNTITKYGGYLGQLKEKLDSLSDEELQAIAKAVLEVAKAGPKLLILGKALTTVAGVINGFSTVTNVMKGVGKSFGKVTTFGGKLVEVFKLVSGGAGTLHEALTLVFGTVGTTVAGIVAVIGGVVTAVTSFISMLKDGFSWVKEALMVVGIAIAAVGAIILGVPAAIAAVVAAIVAVVATIVVVVKEHWQEIVDFFKNLPEKFGELKDKVVEVFSNLKDSAMEKLTGFKDTVVNFFTTTIPNAFNNFVSTLQGIGMSIWTTIQNVWNSIVTFFTEGIPNFIASVITWISNLPYQIGYFIGQILGHIVQFGINVWTWVTTQLPIIIQGIITWFSELPGKIWTFLLDIINKIIEWGINTYNSACEWITNTINSVVTFFSELPGKIWTFLTDVISKIQAWGQSAWEKAKTYTSRLISSVVTFFSELPGKIWKFLTDVISKIKAWGTDMVNKGREAAKNLVDTVLTKIKELPDKIKDCGRNIVEGLWNGITGAGDWIKQKVGEFAKGILDGMKEALGIHSPSRLFRDEVGKYIALGVGEGFMDHIAKVYKKMKASVDFETQKISANISANAALKTAQGSNQTIQNNNDYGVNVNQNFYGKEQSPHEIAKETRNTLRREAYGI